MDQNTPITVTLTLADWNYVVSLLMTRPYSEVGVLIPVIQQQASQQVPAEAFNQAPVEAPVSE